MAGRTLETARFALWGVAALVATPSAWALQQPDGTPIPVINPVVTTYSIEAVACNAGSCPDAALAATPGYVERKRLVTANTP